MTSNRWMTFWNEVYSSGKVSDHISLKEYQCHHCGETPYDSDTLSSLISEDGLDSVLDAIEAILDLFEDLRDELGHPIIVTSGFRCKTRQEQLRKLGYKAAKISPHNLGIALDIVPGDELENERAVGIIKTIAPETRIGFKTYGKRFIHIDQAFRISIDEMLVSNDHREMLKRAWVKGARW